MVSLKPRLIVCRMSMMGGPVQLVRECSTWAEANEARRNIAGGGKKRGKESGQRPLVYDINGQLLAEGWHE